MLIDWIAPITVPFTAKVIMVFRITRFRVASAGLVWGVLGLAPLAVASEDLSPALWPSAHAPLRDTRVDEFVDQLMTHMSLEEKVGQMIQADIASITPAEQQAYQLGSILAGGNAAPGGNTRSSPQAWLDLTDAFHRASAAYVGGHQPIPILFGIDAVHGNAKLVGATIFPHNVGLGAAHDPDLIQRIGTATAAEAAAIGIDWAFAPTVAVVRDVRWGRSYESYSEDPVLVASYAAAMVMGLQGRVGSPDFMSAGHTLSSVKHFLGDGGTSSGRDQGDTAAPESELSGVHGAGYPAAIDAGALIVMASYNSWNGIKLHANRYLLTEVLKGRLGFDGFVVGDWNAHEQVPGCTKYQCATAIMAGVDMLMAPDGWKDLYRNTVAQVRSGELPTTRIDDAVRRILRVKVLAGLFSRPNPTMSGDAGRFAVIGSAAHRAIAREAVRKSLVLLKNNDQLLPLSPRLNVLVAGRAADDVGVQSGGWTIDWQGDHNTAHDFPGATSIFQGIQAAVSTAGGSATLSRDGKFAARPDVAIVVFGEGPYAEFQGDRENLAFSPDNHADLRLLERLRRQKIPTVAVFVSGRPLWVNPEINAAGAFVAAWLPGSEGEGVADVLFKDRNGAINNDFTGRLGFSWPRTAMPVTFESAGHVAGAQFERGYGLDYRTTSQTPPLATEPRIDARFAAPSGSLFHAGHATAPWTLFVAQGTGEDEVHVTTAEQSSPGGALRVTFAADSMAAVWSGSGNGILRISGRARDMVGEATAGAAIEMRYRVDRAPAAPVGIGMRCTEASCNTASGALLDIGPALRRAGIGVWRSLSVPLSCFGTLHADLAHVEEPFMLTSAGRLGLTVSEVRLNPRGARMPACPLPLDR